MLRQVDVQRGGQLACLAQVVMFKEDKVNSGLQEVEVRVNRGYTGLGKWLWLGVQWGGQRGGQIGGYNSFGAKVNLVIVIKISSKSFFNIQKNAVDF